MYEYKANVLKVVDGDTLDLDIDLGLDIHVKMRVRLLGVNAPERFTEEGRKVTEFVCSLLPIGSDVVIKTVKDKKEKYGRYLGYIFLSDGRCLNDLLKLNILV